MAIIKKKLVSDEDVLKCFAKGKIHTLMCNSLANQAISLILSPSDNHLGKLDEIKECLRLMDDSTKKHLFKKGFGIQKP
ncbi:MAG: hypothetical protein Unbinned5350contig1001_30 [Prokaryotic dsDNA virus sp.]|nr:MAG: hypothetical protein Unbinned5350contig1001_30 [Prokaryotic dsDNA virus sp.]|tara:strand:- start:17995 stop:18231 length:237 start_codon:yes stop_codon:yes gene_type:complete